jgi:hypothetical protein
MKRYILIAILLIPAVCFGASGRITDGAGDDYYIDSPYDGNDLRDIQYAQLNDVMYLTHADYAPQKLTRLDHANWTIADVNWLEGPFLDENTDEDITITPSAVTGSGITLTASSAIFDANHVTDLGALWRITESVDSNSVEGTWNQTTADTNSTSVAVGEGQDYIVSLSGIWWATVNIQRSYDDGTTWETVYSHTDRFSGTPFQYNGTETLDDADYRLNILTLHSYGGRADKYVMNYSITALNYLRQGIVRITAFSSTTSVTADVIYDLGGTAATWRWAEGAWSEYRGWPRAVCFYQNRLCLAGTTNQPNMLWCSQSSDFENFNLGSGLDNESIARELGAAGQNPIMWIKDRKGIVAGTTGAIIRVGTPSAKYVFTPSTVTSERSVETGSCSIQPGLTAGSLIYVDRNRRKVRDLKYDVAVDDLLSPDLTIFADDITDPNVQEMAWQKRPSDPTRLDGSSVTTGTWSRYLTIRLRPSWPGPSWRPTATLSASAPFPAWSLRMRYGLPLTGTPMTM